MTATIAINILGGLAVFLFGMRVMSVALQTVAGDRMRQVLRRATENRLMGVVTGFSVTAVVQSSSATTVMMVGFVSAGLLTLMQATGVIMGANIGTTVTGWIVSLLGFKLKISAFALPAVAVGFFARFLKREQITAWGEVLVGFGILFLGLGFLKDALPDVKQSPALATWVHAHQAAGYLSTLMVIGVGTALTVVVQSSSAMMAVTLTAAANGLIDFRTGAALVLGENIGTTVTALLAALGAPREALRAASIHAMFNVGGVAWVWLLFGPFIALVDWLVPGDPTQRAAIPNHLAMFHTAFNITNMLIALPLARFLAAAATSIIPDSECRRDTVMISLDTTLVPSPAAAVSNARPAIRRMLDGVLTMYDELIPCFGESGARLAARVKRIRQLEDEIDRAEERIADYLVAQTRQRIGGNLADEIGRLLDVVNELERTGDQCKRLAEVIQQRRADRGVGFGQAPLAELTGLAAEVRVLFGLLRRGIDGRVVPGFFDEACRLKDGVVASLQVLQAANFRRLGSGEHDAPAGLLFTETLGRLEKVADHGIRMAAAIGRPRR